MSFAVAFAFLGAASASIDPRSVTDPVGDVELFVAGVVAAEYLREDCAPPQADILRSAVSADVSNLFGVVTVADGAHRGLACGEMRGLSSREDYGFSYSAMVLVDGAATRVDVQGRTTASEMCIDGECGYDAPVSISRAGDDVTFAFPREFDTHLPGAEGTRHVVVPEGTAIDAILGWSRAEGTAGRGLARVPWHASDDSFQAMSGMMV